MTLTAYERRRRADYARELLRDPVRMGGFDAVCSHCLSPKRDESACACEHADAERAEALRGGK